MNRFRAVLGGIEVTLEPAEVTVMSGLTTLLGSAGVEKSDPAREWLNPVLYPDDAAASRDFERLTAKESAEVRSSDRQTFAESVQAAGAGTIVLTSEDGASWARVLAESRIVLAARRGVSEAGSPEASRSDSAAALLALLGGLQEELVLEMIEMMEDSQ